MRSTNPSANKTVSPRRFSQPRRIILVLCVAGVSSQLCFGRDLDQAWTELETAREEVATFRGSCISAIQACFAGNFDDVVTIMDIGIGSLGRAAGAFVRAIAAVADPPGDPPDITELHNTIKDAHGMTQALTGQAQALRDQFAQCPPQQPCVDCDAAFSPLVADAQHVDQLIQHALDIIAAHPPTIIGAVSRKTCDVSIDLVNAGTSEPRQGGITQVVFSYDLPPQAIELRIEEATCAGGGIFSPYKGAAQVQCSATGNELVCSFMPGLENERTYLLTVR